jgi:hypothetical protein
MPHVRNKLPGRSGRDQPGRSDWSPGRSSSCRSWRADTHNATVFRTVVKGLSVVLHLFVPFCCRINGTRTRYRKPSSIANNSDFLFGAHGNRFSPWLTRRLCDRRVAINEQQQQQRCERFESRRRCRMNLFVHSFMAATAGSRAPKTQSFACTKPYIAAHRSATITN